MADYSNNYQDCIKMAINALKVKFYSQAEENIKQAMVINPHSPIVHNLYGILEEFLMDDGLACKHYRAAYALDPTYKPAIRNLERITTFYSRCSKSSIDYGDQPEEEAENLYEIIYDKGNIGHLVKKERSEIRI